MDPLTLIAAPFISAAISALLGGGGKSDMLPPKKPPYQRRRPFNAPIPAPSMLAGNMDGSTYRPFTAPGFSQDPTRRLAFDAMLGQRV